MKPLTDDAVRVKLQRKEVDHMKKIIGQHQQQVEKIDLSLICDGQIHGVQGWFSNYLVNLSQVFSLSRFIQQNMKKMREKIYKFLAGYTEMMGSSNIIQPVT